MVMYATVEELAAQMGRPVEELDEARAEQLLTIASARFSTAADTWFEPTVATLEVAGTGQRMLRLPHRPVQSVDKVEINDQEITDYTRIGNTLYRVQGFGRYVFPPDKVEVTYTHGYDEPPDDVKGVVLDMVEAAYEVAAGLTREQIDDYAVSYSTGVGEIVALTAGARDLADYYRGVFAA